MDSRVKIGILRETKNPPDRRVPLTPPQIVTLEELYPFVEFFVQPSDIRCYSDEEYEYLNIPLKEDLRDCSILMGVKEIDKRTLIPGKTYICFSHVAKKQPHNRDLFREMSRQGNSLYDYEYFKDDKGARVVAFGRWAGIVGAYNGLRARGIRTNRFRLKPAHQCRDVAEMWAGLRLIELKPGLKILITGSGRVAHGAIETLQNCNIVQVSPKDFLTRDYDVPVLCQAGPEYYVHHKDNLPFRFSHFVSNPGEYESSFYPFTEVTDILISGHFWDPGSPRLFSKEDMKNEKFRISVIADVSCDINGSVPATLRSTTISDPFYGYNPFLEAEEPPFTRPSNITVMAIDNLPGELPRDASLDFGNQLIKGPIHYLVCEPFNRMITDASILFEGKLTPQFAYLEDYLNFGS